MVIRIALVEDQRIVREAVAAVLEREADFALVGEAATAPEAIDLAIQARPDVLILDVTLLEGNGVDVARAVREFAPEVRIVALSVHTDAAHVHAMLRAGAIAYIDKFSAFEELGRGIRFALQGTRYLSAQLKEALPPESSEPAVRHRQPASTGEASLSQVARGRRRLKGGQMLFSEGDPCGSLYWVSCGFFKTVVLDGGGRGQITGFFIPGDLVGLEGLSHARHRATAIALEDSQAAVLPYALIATRTREDHALQHLIHVAFSRDIGRKQSVMLLLGSMRARERLAYFLLDLSSRFARRGYSPADLRLPMTREDIGSYLGLTVETVSRVLTRFQRERMIDLRQRQLKLLDVPGLRRLAGASGD